MLRVRYFIICLLMVYFLNFLILYQSLQYPSFLSKTISGQLSDVEKKQILEIGKYEREITLKYWELRHWFKEFSRSKGKVKPSAPPYFFDFDSVNISLWGNGYLRYHEDDRLQSGDRVLAQLVWLMQNEIQQYFLHLNHSTSTRPKPKRIYIGKFGSWHIEHLRLSYRKNRRVVRIPDEVLDTDFYESAYECQLITKVPKKWDDVDAIVTFASKGAILHQRIAPPIVNIPWFKFTNEPPYIENVGRQLSNQAVCTYFRDAPVQHSYGRWVYYDPLIRKLPKNKNFGENRTEMVAMLVSNCNAANDRLLYARELKKYIQVDIFGRCGTSCHGARCYSLIREKYKFYLSFENSNCRDYITEKFFAHALRNGLIPVAMGAHPDDYRRLAPLNSYIHVEDFKSPKQLAEYLLLVASDNERYKKYFEWHGTGEFVDAEFFQRLCPMLYYMDKHPFTKGSWFQWNQDYKINRDGDTMCLKRGKWFWLR